MTSRRTVRAVDDVWLQLDHPDNLMVVEGLMLLQDPVDLAQLRTLVAERVLDRYPVFGQRPVADTWPRPSHSWEDDPGFDLERHVTESHLAAPGDDVALQDHVAHLLSRAVDHGHPLWEMHLVHGYGDGCAIYSRLHHAMADGMALNRVVLALTDDSATPHTGAPPPRRAPALSGRLTPLRQVASRAAGLPGLALAAPPVLAHLAFARPPDGPLAATPHHDKRAVWADPVPVPLLSAIGHLAGCTVTDVTMAALAGALRAWLEVRGADTTRDVPTMVPVDLRRPEAPLPAELGNQFALVLLDLPVSVPTMLGRLAATHARMNQIKGSPEARVTYAMLQVMGMTVPAARRVLTDFFAAKAVGVTTSVRGPDQPLWLAGSRVERILGWAPVSGGQTISTCVIGYDGQVHVGFKVDTAAVPDPQTIVRAFADEIAGLAALTEPS